MIEQEQPLWSDTHNFESVNLFQTKHLSNAIYNLFEDIQVLKEEKAELEGAVRSALFGTLLDENGNRGEDGLTKFPDNKRIVKTLSEALKEQVPREPTQELYDEAFNDEEQSDER